jgi:hypothetical protein
MRPPPLELGHASRRPLPAWAAPAAAAAAVLVVAGGVLLASPDGERARSAAPRTTSGAEPTAPAAEATALPERTVYATDRPELGTGPVPVDVIGKSILARDPGETSPAAADVLARLVDGSGELVLVAHAFADGRICAAAGYLPPADNLSVSRVCGDSSGPPYSEGPIAVSGVGELRGETTAPAAAYGSAVPGTRTVEFSSPGRDTVRVPARDAGDRYGHRAYLIAPWDLDASLDPTTIRAYDEQGRLLAALTP